MGKLILFPLYIDIHLTSREGCLVSGISRGVSQSSLTVVHHLVEATGKY